MINASNEGMCWVLKEKIAQHLFLLSNCLQVLKLCY